MTKRTTEQQRARELQRAERTQGNHVRYHDALNRVRAQAQSAGPAASPVAGFPVQITTAEAAQEAEKALAAVLFERTTALMASRSRAELAAMVGASGFDGERFHPGMFSTQELAGLLVQYEDRVRRGEARPADFMPLAVFPAVRTAAEEAEAALAHELFERTQALMASHSKQELAAMVRDLGGGGGKYGPELWAKQELAGHLVWHHDAAERRQA
ncbi:hypothetical protein ACIRPK_36345 [Kitasatospora sp. NPDC101801]|uniref:hypothetical protein n=1 Tax=Kitasatospora sp. NPDC101801 TaxID=3364103 RepID=UPI00380D5441